MTITPETAVPKKPRNWSRQTKFKMKRTSLLKNRQVRQAVSRARINRIIKEQNQSIKSGDMKSELYLSGLDEVTRISQRASEASAQIVERFLMKLLLDSKEAARHANRVTIKTADVKLALRRLTK